MSRLWVPSIYSEPVVISAQTIPTIVEQARNDVMTADRLFQPNSPPLFPFQRVTMRAIHDHFITWLQAIRGTSKSWIVARTLLNEGLTHPLKIGFTAPTFRQAMHPFNYVDQFIQMNSDPNLPLSLSREQEGITVRGSMEATIKLKNGTVFKALPMGNGERLRGERFDILHCDEFFMMERAMFLSHLLPFLLGHRTPGAFGPKLVLTTSAEYEDCYAYTVLARQILPKMIQEDALADADPNYKRTHCVLDWNIDDVRDEGYQVDQDVLDLLLEGANEEERQRALYNKWVGTSGQFFPSNLADRMSDPNTHIEHRRSSPEAKYIFSVDVATQRNGDFFVIDVFKMLGNRKMAFVNSYWDRGLTADEMAKKIMDFDERFDPTYIIMDKGGGGLFVRDSLKKRTLEMRNGDLYQVTRPILEHNEFGVLSGERKLVFNKYGDELVRAGLAGFRSRGGEYIHTDDVLVHHLHEGLKQLFLQNDMPILIPAEYTDEGGEESGDALIFDRIRTGIHQLRHLALDIKEMPDGQKEVVRTKGGKVPKYVWKSGQKDGASAFIYGYIGYAIMYRDSSYLEITAEPIFQIENYDQPRYDGMIDAYPDQIYRH